ncbi:PREDICTED: uncharacterized protein LOC105362440 [Ceratosolen solmsi marchali]|uniref:Uncharacterized protein LOC105362440 n=1 Tax=Ceratosolen solmsi marchali TaxID=326594 RepID=A0AAJ6YHJ2_9HYME|nr:PREDICTED: uncharacterized protein LOC105362440 [Ceratosolen solmsi marchali]
MTSKRLILPLLMALIIWGNLNLVNASSKSASSSQSASEESMSSMIKKTATPVSSVTVDEAGARKNVIATGSRDTTRHRDPPGSPVKLFMPDEFQFYTLNGYGQLVMKQMSKQEIQGMIAASVGGVNIVDDGGISLIKPGQQQQTQLTNDTPKVSDVVQNVQKVLKSELNKPKPVNPLGSSIPGSVNSQWTNMLPYILSGGSLDQQDISQDASVILSTADADHSYMNVMPLQDDKPANNKYGPGTNYVQIQTTSNEEKIKLPSHKPIGNINEKPIYLLGNMALDSDILGAQEAYILPTEEKPNRPILTPLYQKLTTKPFVTKDTATKVHNSTNGKPTLYIPLSVSSSLQQNSQNHKNHSQFDNSLIPNAVTKTTTEKSFTTLSYGDAESTTIGAPAKKSTTHIYSNEPASTSVPTVQVPVNSVEKITSSTQRINEQTPIFEILPTISPNSVLNTIKDGLFATELNEEHVGSIKKPGVIYESSTSYHTPYDILSKPSTISLMSTSSYYPLQTSTKINHPNVDSSTHQSIHQPITKINTIKPKQSTRRPINEIVTKQSFVKTASTSIYNFLNDIETRISTTLTPTLSHQSTYEAAIESTDVPEITQPQILETTTKQNSVNIKLNTSQSIQNIQEPIRASVIQQSSEHDNDSNISLVSKNTFTENTTSDLLKLKLEQAEIAKNDNSKTSSYYNQIDTTTNIIVNERINHTTTYSGAETKNNMLTISIDTNFNHSEISNIISSSNEQMTKNKPFNKDEETVIDSDVKTMPQKSNINNNYHYYTIALENETTKLPEIIYTEADNIPVAVTETSLLDIYPISESNIGEFKHPNESLLPADADNLKELSDPIEFKESNRYNVTEGSLNTHKKDNITNNASVNKSEKIPTWIYNEMTTTRFIPIDETTTEYYEKKYDFNDVKKPIANTYDELYIHKQEETTTPFKENYTTDQSSIDSTVEYNTPLNKIENLSYTNDYSKESLNKDQTKNSANTLMENNTSQYKYSKKNLDNKSTTPTYISNYEIETLTNDKQTTANYITDNQNTDFNFNIYTQSYYDVTLPIREYNKFSQTVRPENENTLLKSVNNSNTKSSMQLSTILPIISMLENNSLEIESSTSSNEKLEIITEKSSIEKNNRPTKFTTKIAYDKKPIQLQEDELSTIKVIPVYDDDDTSIYNLPSNKLNQVTSTTTFNIKSSGNTENVFNITKLSALPSHNIMQHLKPINQINYTSDSFVPIISQKLNYTTKNTVTYNTGLPNLRETFYNYMKDHYDSKLPTTNDYNEVSHFTTFPADVDANVSNDTSDLPTLTTLNHTRIDVFKHPTFIPLDEEPQLNTNPTTDVPKYNNTESISEYLTTVAYNFENLANSKAEQNPDSITKGTISKEIYSTKYVDDDNFQTSTTKFLGAINKDSTETPIIYLDLKNSDSDEQSISHQSNANNVHSSLFTRIKINNPVIDVEKIVSEATDQTNTPSLVHYTLSNYYKEPNNIASGLIAGYPTYDQVQPTAEYFTDSTPYDVGRSTSSPTTNKDSVYVSSNKGLENISKIDENVSYQEKSTTLLLDNDKNYMDKTSSIPIYISEGEGGSTYNYYESYTSVPSESIPMSSKTKIPSQTQDKYDSSLEKISDLIMQLQDKTLESDRTEYEYSIGVTTTDIPLDRVETISDDSNFTPADHTFTTIVDKKDKTSLTKPDNSTHLIHQNLPFSRPYQNSSELTGQYLTTKKYSTLETSTLGNLKVKYSSSLTTVMTTAKQPVTAKPYIMSTYSAAKGSFEKIQSTIDKSAGRINLEEEKNKMQTTKLTEHPKFTIKNKIYYSSDKRPTNEGSQSYVKKTTKPVNKSTTLIKEQTTSKPVAITKESSAEKWTLIPQKNLVNQTVDVKQSSANSKEGSQKLNPQIVSLDHATGAIGLDQSNKALDKDVVEFVNMCNELSLKFWALANSELSSSRSITLSPFGMISTLAMIFLGARGLTSNQMNDIMKLDDVVTFNPHLVFQNITDTVTLARGQGIQNAAFVRALFADRLKVRKIMPFYKEQAQQFYEGAVVDINFSTAGDILRRRTNLLIRKQTGGRIKDFVKTHTVSLRSPLTSLSANVFQMSCDSPDASSDGRDGEMYFAVSQTVKQRKLVPIPAVVWKSGVSAGYEPGLDATAVALGDVHRPVSLIMVMPGQQGLTAAGDNLERLEQRLFGNPSDNALEKLLKVIVPRRVDVQIPKFSHRSIVNITSALKKLGFDQLFAKTADLKGINGAGHDLYLADMLQMNLFATCGDENKLGGRPLSETFPGTSTRHTRAWEMINNMKTGIDDLENSESVITEINDNIKHNEENDCDDSLTSDNSSRLNESPEALHSQSAQSGKRDTDKSNIFRQKQRKKLWWLTPIKRRRCRNRRQVEIEKPRMKMDKPFLYLIRHNLTGLILHIGRFNPKNQS